jgi:integrase
VDIRVVLPDGSERRLRRKAPMTARSAALRWGQQRERHWYQELTRPAPVEPKEVPTLEAFWPRFLDGHARANRQKPSGIATKEMVGRVHLLPHLGKRTLDTITTERVQHLKAALGDRSPKTVNNVLTVLNMLLKKAVEWGVLDRMRCTIRLLPVLTPTVPFHDFAVFESLIEGARRRGPEAYAVVLLAGEAGLRRGEIAALEWRDVDFKKRQLCVQRSIWKGHLGAPKGGRLRYVPMTTRVAAALQALRHLRGSTVFLDTKGQRATEQTIGEHAAHAARLARISHQGIHILRHTFCSHLAMRGAPARAIQELAGHADLKTTQRYMHLSPAALESAIRLLEMNSSHGEILETGGSKP